MIKKTKLVGMVLISSTVLGMVVNTGITSAFAAETQAVSTTSPANGQRGIEFQTKGTLALSGSAMDGLELSENNTVTEGILHFDYEVKSVASVNWNDRTITTIKLPRELNQFAEDKSLLTYISEANFKYHSIISINHNYTPDEMTIVKDTESDDTYLLKFENPAITGAGLFTSMDVTFNLDLGAMVMETGHRIPDAYNKSTYDFASTISSADELIDWELVGSTDGEKTIPRGQLDPGYQIQQQKPVIMDPVYDTDSIIEGSGIPGAHIVVYQSVGDTRIPIGEGTVNANGFYKVSIPKQGAGVTLSVTQDAGVGESPADVTIVQQTVTTKPDAPQVDQERVEWGDIITGKMNDVNNEIKAVDAYTGAEYEVVVEADGSFSLDTTNIPVDILPTNVLITENNKIGASDAVNVLVYRPGVKA